MKKFLVIVSISVFMLINTQIGHTQTSKELEPIAKDIKSLKEGQKTLQKDVEEIKKLLQGLSRPPQQAEFKEAVLNIGDDPFKGDKNAKLTLVEFTDYQ